MVATGGKVETAHRGMGLQEVRETAQTGEKDLAIAGPATVVTVVMVVQAIKAKVAMVTPGKPMTKPMWRNCVKRRLIVGSSSMKLRRN
jgi:hypothetical protein